MADDYVALVNITWNGVLAYVPGDPVTADAVKANGYTKDQVAKRNSLDAPSEVE